MRGIDRYAWANAIADVDPLQKASLAGVAILLCLSLNGLAVSLTTLLWMTACLLCWARLPLRAVINALLGEFFFLLLSVLGLLISIGAVPTMPVVWSWSVGATWFYISQASLWLVTGLVLRALGCASAMSFLALTTPLVDLIDLLRRLRLPDLLIDLMTISYRSIFVLLEVLERIYQAQESRLGYRNAARAWVSASTLASRIFLESFRRTQQLGLALESRGYDGGALRVLPATYRRTVVGWWLLGGLMVTLFTLFFWL